MMKPRSAKNASPTPSEPPSQQRARSTPRPRAVARRPRGAVELPIEAPADKHFWVNQGPTLGSLIDLRNAIGDGITDDQYAHHVSRDHNDFAQWVEDVFGDMQCGKALRRARTRTTAAKAIDAALARRKKGR